MRKRKGIRRERELVKMFWEAGWAAARVAGSGSVSYPSTDVIAGKAGRVLALESRTVNNTKIYVGIEKINQMKEFVEKSGYEGWFAINFDRQGWFFVPLEEMKCSLKLEEMRLKAKRFEDLTNQ